MVSINDHPTLLINSVKLYQDFYGLLIVTMDGSYKDKNIIDVH